MLDEILVSSTKARLEELDVEAARRSAVVQSIEAELREAKRAHEEVVMERGRVFALLAPVSRVPYEILARIFVLGNVGYGGYGSTPDIRDEIYWAVQYPMRLSHVNRQFRHVAITTASLWTMIYIRRVALHPRTSLYLSRSQGCLIDIRVSELPDSTPIAEVDELFRILLPADRWRSLRMRLPLQHIRGLLQRAGPAQNLKALELRGRKYWEETDEEADLLTPFEGQNPLLSSMTLRKASCRWGAGMFSALTNLSLVLPSDISHALIQKHLHMLQQAPKLKTLVITGNANPHEVDDVPVASIVRMEALESLTIGALDPLPATFILSSLCPPKLHSCTLQSWDLDDYDGALVALNQPHYRALRCLSLLDIEFFDPNFFALGFSDSDIEDLEFLSPEHAMPQLLTAMELTPNVIFPKLQRLKFFRCYSSAIELLRRFLELWRSKGKGPLIVLLPQHGAVQTAKDELEIMVMDGLANFETFGRAEPIQDHMWGSDDEDSIDFDSNQSEDEDM